MSEKTSVETRIIPVLSKLVIELEGILKEGLAEKVEEHVSADSIHQIIKGYCEAAIAGLDVNAIASNAAEEVFGREVDVTEVAKESADERCSDIDFEDLAKDAVSDSVSDSISSRQIKSMAEEKVQEMIDDQLDDGTLRDLARDRVDSMVNDEIKGEKIREWAEEGARLYASDVLTPKEIEKTILQEIDCHIGRTLEGNFPSLVDLIKDSAERVILGQISGNYSTMDEMVSSVIEKYLDYQLICDLVQRAVDNSKPIPKPSLWRRFLSWFSR